MSSYFEVLKQTLTNFWSDFVQNDITPVLEFCLKYIGALVLQGINGGHMLGLKEKSCHHVRWGSRQTPKQQFKNGLPESAIGHSQMLTFSLPVESYLLLNLFLFYFNPFYKFEYKTVITHHFHH